MVNLLLITITLVIFAIIFGLVLLILKKSVDIKQYLIYGVIFSVIAQLFNWLILISLPDILNDNWFSVNPLDHMMILITIIAASVHETFRYQAIRGTQEETVEKRFHLGLGFIWGSVPFFGIIMVYLGDELGLYTLNDLTEEKVIYGLVVYFSFILAHMSYTYVASHGSYSTQYPFFGMLLHLSLMMLVLALEESTKSYLYKETLVIIAAIIQLSVVYFIHLKYKNYEKQS
ncbi:MAG: hypothetical protein KAR35_07235 [Candidatus Heimdallarchaeota archaeon]|nr:hypothetical protein [Candidatus Heimdallarchaeota archaeon]MCK5049153.1 hypothetical protein [Candidatus Heimdallarchaeota archaeon]